MSLFVKWEPVLGEKELEAKMQRIVLSFVFFAAALAAVSCGSSGRDQYFAISCDEIVCFDALSSGE